MPPYHRDHPQRPTAVRFAAILAFLRSEREPRTAAEVGQGARIKPAYASHLLSRLAKAGKVKKVARGTYQAIEEG